MKIKLSWIKSAINVGQLIVKAVHNTEQAAQNQNLSGADKLKLAISEIAPVLHQLSANGAIPPKVKKATADFVAALVVLNDALAEAAPETAPRIGPGYPAPAAAIEKSKE